MRWEYKTINFTKRSFFTGAIELDNFDTQLNELGREGWELVSVTQNQMQRGVVAVFKRPR
jgi:hypothetical protein